AFSRRVKGPCATRPRAFRRAGARLNLLAETTRLLSSSTNSSSGVKIANAPAAGSSFVRARKSRRDRRAPRPGGCGGILHAFAVGQGRRALRQKIRRGGDGGGDRRRRRGRCRADGGSRRRALSPAGR